MKLTGRAQAWIESNKMELRICSPWRGKCVEVCVAAGSIVNAADDLVFIAQTS